MRSQNKVISLSVLLFAALLASCSNKDGVKGADGETPVKYVICGAGESNCFVVARFKDLDGCEGHKIWSDMSCDYNSEPGKMTCFKDTNPSQVAFSYCTF